jgi:ATP-dependent DNA helicase Rep
MLDDLNPRQREAIRYIGGPLLVLAGAGSGKTRVITRKIAWLVQETGLSPRAIAAVTFTNKAAREMKSRVGELLKGKDGRGLTVSTFHTLGLELLRREAKTLGYKPGFSIFDDQDSLGVVRSLAEKGELLDQERLDGLYGQISRWKNALISPQQAIKDAEDEREGQSARFYALYQRQLKAYNAVDFDDLIGLPVTLFREHPEALERWQSKIRYLLVDEYQDTNTAQYQLVKILVGVRGALTVVGDDDQSIYAWRGAQPENLKLLQEDFPQLKVVKLEQNYRSAGRILKAANQVISNNPHVFTKKLWSDKGYGDPLRVITVSDDSHEAERVVSEILGHKFQTRGDFADYAILYRGNHQSKAFEKILRLHRIPYFLSGGTSFFSRTEIKDIMAYLRLVVNPDDDNAFLRIVNTPRREIGPATLEKLGTYAQERGVSLFTACFEMGLAERLGERALEHLQRFAHWLNAISDRAGRGADPVEIAREVVQEIDYETWLKDTCNDLKTAERRMENVLELISWLKTAEDQTIENKTLSEHVARITLMDILERQNEEDQSDRVALMTLHAAKGLEFPHVFMVGVEEDILPHQNSQDEAGIQEERRLMYVGMTRAQKTLTFTLAARRKRYGEQKDCEPSRFLAELPQDDVTWEGRQHRAGHDPQQQKVRGKAHLDNLRGMLQG